MKKQKFPYKILRPEQFEELKSKSTEFLLEEFLNNNKRMQFVSKQKKEDSKLNEIKERIKTHRAASDELQEAKNSLKELRQSVDSEISEDIEDKKALEGGYRDELKGIKETIHAIQSIIEKRKK